MCDYKETEQGLFLLALLCLLDETVDESECDQENDCAEDAL